MAEQLKATVGVELWATVLAIVVLVGTGCVSTSPPAPERAQRPAEGAYLPTPLAAYPRSLSAAEAESLRAAHRGLMAGEGTGAAVEVAGRLLAANPDLEPAQILWAQADFVEGRYQEALERAQPVAARLESYVAAQLVAGRSAEKLDQVREAFEIYLRVEKLSDIAARRSVALRPRALEIAVNRAHDLLSRGRLDEASRELDLVSSWAPNEIRTLHLIAEFAATAGAPARELEAIKRILAVEPSEELVRRRARLELTAGDAGEGLRILEELTRLYPEDSELAVELERAKFVWRLELLPADARDLLRMPELTRGDYAKLLFWMFPDVRYGRPTRGRIASDILDHPYRQEIARVLNLDLMRFDSTLHRFHPDRLLKRQEGLESMLEILGRRNPRPACFGSDEPALRMSVGRLCALATRCGLFMEAGDCLPEAVASGQFIETIGFRALDVLGVE